MCRTVVLTCLGLMTAILLYFGRSAALVPADLTLVNPSQVNTLDPQQMSWTADIRIALNIWEGLARHDRITMQPIGGVASWPPEVSADGLRYTFMLRRDARWSNGDAVTAGDFVRGWRRALEPGTAADYAALLLAHIRGAQTYYTFRQQAIRQLADLQSADRRAERLSLLRDHAAEMDKRWQEVGIRALNDHTLAVELVRPTPYFLELTALSVMLPIHQSIERLRQGDPAIGLDDHGLVVYDNQWTKPDYHRNGYPGLTTNGPFQLSDWQFRRRLRLTRNSFHYDAAGVALGSIDIMMFENPNTAFLAYETGVVDWLTDLNVDYAGALLRQRREGRRPDVHNAPAFGTYFYNLNCRDPQLPDGRDNPFVDARVRQAFSMAVDRAALCRSVAEKENRPLSVLIPPGTIPGYPAVVGLPYDPRRAADLLDAAGYADRADFPEIVILVNTGFIHERVAQALAHMWQTALGIRVAIQGQETKTFGSHKAKHNFQIARGAWYGDYLDPTTFLDVFATGNGNNDSGYSDRRYDALLRQAAECPDPQQRLRLLADAETLLVTEGLPIIPIYQYTNPQAHRPWVHGIVPNARELYSLRDIQVVR